MKGKDILPVVCAIVVHEGKVLAVKKAAHQSYAGKWEFPGGKVEAGESDKQALKREIIEELKVEIIANMRLDTVFYEENSRIIELRPYICEISLGDVTLQEHAALNWASISELEQLDWAPADIPVMKEVCELLSAI
ncbi:MAG: NUDIX domain-containing protein [Bacteroidetes bacterium]|nr:NUDIX domain-containing protein [Bacteroidota bacterium]